MRLHRHSLILLGCCALAAGCAKGAASPVAKKEAPIPAVTVTTPIGDVVTDYEDFTGQTAAMLSVDVRARVTGYLDKVHFKDGDEVNEGALLFEIDPRPYQAELDRTEATLVQAEAHQKRLDADFRRASNLIARGNISREEYDKIAGDRAEAEAAVGIAKAQRDLAKLDLSYTKVPAPIAGRLSRRQVDPGNLVKADDTILTNVVSLDPMFLYFDIDEQTVLKLRNLIRKGTMKSRQQAQVPVLAALSTEEGFPHRGTINFSENKVDPNTGTLRIRALIENPKVSERAGDLRILSPGMYMKVRLPVGDPHEAILVPEQSVGTDQGRKFVYVVQTDSDGAKTGKVVERTVETGALSEGFRVITAGLKAGEKIVYRGLQRIRPGANVKFEVEAVKKDVEPGAVADASGKGDGTQQNAGQAPSPSPTAPAGEATKQGGATSPLNGGPPRG